MKYLIYSLVKVIVKTTKKKTNKKINKLRYYVSDLTRLVCGTFIFITKSEIPFLIFRLS